MNLKIIKWNLNQKYRCLLVSLIAVFISGLMANALPGNNIASEIRSLQVDNTHPS
jgi:hypothetical protein